MVHRSVLDVAPALQRTYMTAFRLLAQRAAEGASAVVLDDEISERMGQDYRTTRAHLVELGRDLLEVDVTGNWHLCVRGLHGESSDSQWSGARVHAGMSRTAEPVESADACMSVGPDRQQLP